MGSTGGPEKLILAGCGSGGAGALFNMDFAPQWVPSNIIIHALLDSAYALDIAPVTAHVAMPLSEQTAKVLLLTNASGRIMPECGGNYPASEQWKCLFAQFRLPFAKLPYMLAQPLYEAAQLRGDEGGAKPPYAPGCTALAYANEFGAEMRRQLAALPTHNQVGSALFAPACGTGCLTSSAAFFTVRMRARCVRLHGRVLTCCAAQLAIYPPPGTTVQPSAAAADALTLATAFEHWCAAGALRSVVLFASCL